MSILLCITFLFSYIYEDSDSLHVDNDTLTICGHHQYALKVHIKSHSELFVRQATGAPDSTGWLVLTAPLIVITGYSSIDGSERGHRGGYLNSHPWGYGPGGGGAGGVSGGAGGGGAYGGDGGAGGDYYGGTGGTAYGDSADTLIDLGSGGGAGRLSVVLSNGGAGGAMVSLRGQSIVIDTADVDVRGQNGEPGSSGLEASGGGAGGGIMIWADTVMLHHLDLFASGGSGGDAAFGGGGGAGGGRIKILYSSFLDTSDVTRFLIGGSAGTGGYGNPQPGMSGSFYVGMQTGIHEIVNTLQPELRIKPNPTRGMIILNADRPPGGIVVYDCTGRTVLTTELVRDHGALDLSDLEPGIYFLKSATLAGSTTKLILLR